jgi:hypothetical protein
MFFAPESLILPNAQNGIYIAARHIADQCSLKGELIVSYPVLSRHAGCLRVLFATLALSTAAHAFVRVTLHNGFSYDCTRRELLDSTHTRLFLIDTSSPSAATATADATTNFIDLSTQSIATVEILPDPPPPTPTTQPVAPVATAPDIHSLLSAAGSQHNIDAELLASIVHTESGFRANAVSRTGARGLMQLMPGTARQLGVNDAFQPNQNIAGGTTYFDALLTRYDSRDDTHGLALALAAYNAGPAAVDRYHGIPPFRETRAYVARVMNEFKRRKLALQRQALHPPTGTALASR